jgi:hypothetical protein
MTEFGLSSKGSNNNSNDELSRIISTGIISGGVLSINAGDNTKFDISAGSAFIADQSTSPITIKSVNWSAFTAITLTNLATSFATDIAIDSDGNIVQQNSFTPEELRSLIFLGGIDHSGNTIINNIFSVQIPTNGIGSSLFELTKAIGDINLSGNVFSANGANLKINKSAGTTFSYGRNNASNPKNPHTATQIAKTALSFNYVYDNGSGNGVFLPATTDIDATKYDDGSGTLATVGSGWTIQRILMFSNTGNVFIQYGTETFANKAAATVGLLTATFPSLSGIKTAAVRGYLIVKKTATVLNDDADGIFVEADRFGGIGSRTVDGIDQTFTGIVTIEKGVISIYNNLGNVSGNIPLDLQYSKTEIKAIGNVIINALTNKPTDESGYASTEGFIRFRQDATGSRTLNVSAGLGRGIFPLNVNTAANSLTIIAWEYEQSDDKVLFTVNKDTNAN